MDPVIDMAFVEIDNVHKFFDDLHVLRGVTMEVQRGEVCAILGPSGSGKSTLLRCVNVLEEIQAGSIAVDGTLMGYRRGDNGRLYELTGKEIAAQRASIGMVFQRFNLFPHMTALHNVIEAPVQVKKVAKAEAERRARELLAQVGLADRVDHYPSQLSGGQQQRCAMDLSMPFAVYLVMYGVIIGLYLVITFFLNRKLDRVSMEQVLKNRE